MRGLRKQGFFSSVEVLGWLTGGSDPRMKDMGPVIALSYETYHVREAKCGEKDEKGEKKYTRDTRDQARAESSSRDEIHGTKPSKLERSTVGLQATSFCHVSSISS